MDTSRLEAAQIPRALASPQLQHMEFGRALNMDANVLIFEEVLVRKQTNRCNYG